MVKYYNNGSGRGSVWLERDVRDVEVAGSNPVAPTKIKENKNFSIFSNTLARESQTEPGSVVYL